MEQIASAGEATAELLCLLGFNLNYAPVLDLDHHPELQNGLNQRCWGRDHAGCDQPRRDVESLDAETRNARVVVSIFRHVEGRHPIRMMIFRSRMATKDELMAEDVIPYTALMPELDAIMLAHVVFPEIDAEFPASLVQENRHRMAAGSAGLRQASGAHR